MLSLFVRFIFSLDVYNFDIWLPFKEDIFFAIRLSFKVFIINSHPQNFYHVYYLAMILKFDEHFPKTYNAIVAQHHKLGFYVISAVIPYHKLVDINMDVYI